MKALTQRQGGRGWFFGIAFLLILLLAATPACAETATNSLPAVSGNLPDVGASLVRMIGALALVIGIFFGGVWLFRNWQRVAVRRGKAPLLNVIEVKPLGGRQALYVIGYEQQRMLLASSPSGIHLLSHLPASTEVSPPPADAKMSFGAALQQVLNRKP
jgi:flagellar biogenesis protein FliO